jgi:hypothetical protein
MGEYHNTSAGLASTVNVNDGGQSAIPSSATNAITPDATNVLLFSAASSTLSGQGVAAASDPYTLTSGWTGDYFAGGAAANTASSVGASLDVQTMAVASPAATSNTFTASAAGNVSGSTSNSNPHTSDIIFYLRPKS